MRFTVLHFLLFFTLISAANANSAPGLFWADQINSAILERDSYFSSMQLITDGKRLDLNDNNNKQRILPIIESFSSSDDPWYNFLTGLTTFDTASGLKDYSFKKALTLAQKDPGATWILFLEFSRYNQDVWAEKSIIQLEKLLFESGARSSSIVSKSLISHAMVQEAEGNSLKAMKYYSWAKLFDPLDGTPYLRSAILHFPFSINGLMEELGGFINTFAASWTEQAEIFHVIYTWARLVILFFVLAVFLILIIKYFPIALHSIADLFPADVSLTLRTALSTACVCSFASFGLIPFLWVSAFLIWRFLKTKERLMLSTAILFLVLAPVDTYIRCLFNETLNPQSDIQLLSRAVNEGYSESLHKEALRRINNSPTDYMPVLSAAVYELKNYDYTSASRNIQKSTALKRNDPVILVSAGNYSFLNGDIEDAKNYYRKAIENGETGDAKFNLAQCYLRKMEAITGTEMLNEAAEKQPEKINSFINKNDKHFSKNWPVLRQVIFSDYSPFYFWTEIFPSHSGGWKKTATLWGTRFLGIPPVVSIAVSLLLFIILFVSHSRETHHSRVKKFFECKYCGRVICRKCKSGLLCNSCFEQTRFIRNENALVEKKQTIYNRFHFVTMLKIELMDLLFPGSGMILEGQKGYFISILFLLLTSLVYASYASLLFSGYFTSNRMVYFILVILFAYNIFFAWKRGAKIVKYSRDFIRMQNS